MKILFIGDIVGRAGRDCVETNLLKLKQEYHPDLVIANGENSAHGKGITKKIYNQLINCGVDVITMGNHTFSKDTILSFIDEKEYDQMVRPINMEPHDCGHKYIMKKVNGKKICIVNLLGEVFVNESDGSPFKAMEEVLDKIKADIYFVDFHGEATSEKLAFAYYFKDQVSVVVGTHTHVQTADEKIIGKTAFISDVGMCGVYDSIIGRDVDEILTRFTSKENTRFTIAEGDAQFCGVIIELDDKSGQAKSIERIQIRPSAS